MSKYDYAVLAIYFLFMTSLGLVFRKFSKNTQRLLPRRRQRVSGGWSGATAFMSQFSAWTFTGAASKAYGDGLLVCMIFFGNGLGYLIAYLVVGGPLPPDPGGHPHGRRARPLRAGQRAVLHLDLAAHRDAVRRHLAGRGQQVRVGGVRLGRHHHHPHRRGDGGVRVGHRRVLGHRRLGLHADAGADGHLGGGRGAGHPGGGRRLVRRRRQQLRRPPARPAPGLDDALPARRSWCCGSWPRC